MLLRVAPGVDHRGAGADALADQVDLVVAERLPCGFEIVDPLREAVACEVDAVRLEAVRARAKRPRVGTRGRLAEEIGENVSAR